MPPSVLVVAGGPLQATRLRRLLEGEGYRVAMAAGRTEGLQRARAEQPDVVISDAPAADPDGSSLRRALGADPATRDIPLVVLAPADPPPGEPPSQPEATLRLGSPDLFAPADRRRILERLATLTAAHPGQTDPEAWGDRLRAALDAGRFVEFFQPIVAVGNGHVWQYEVLARMRDEDGQIIAAAEFLAPAERSALVSRIDLLMLQRAIELLRTHRLQGRTLRLAVNISARTLLTESVAESLAGLLSLHRLDPALLTLEITEPAVIADVERAAEAIRDLKRCGCRFALDHFGVGSATIEHLRDLPVDCLKIDGRFVQNLRTSETDRRLVRAMAHMAHDLGREAVAEFVGDAATFELVRELGVDFAQGYYLGRPMAELPPVKTAEKADARLHSLTEREREVLRCIAQGLDNNEIAQALVISAKTVKVHVSRILDKLDVTDRTKAAIVALRAHLVDI